MAKGIFITGTNTDIGKTYITALLIKQMRSIGMVTGYYKAAISGANSVAESDAGYVNRIADIGESESDLVSYLYKNAVSPHLAAKIEGNPVELDVVKNAFAKVSGKYDYIVVEGSGGIVCPIRYDDTERILLEDVVKALGLETIIVAEAGLGAINLVTLTASYLRQKNIGIKGIILNHYTDAEL